MLILLIEDGDDDDDDDDDEYNGDVVKMIINISFSDNLVMMIC